VGPSFIKKEFGVQQAIVLRTFVEERGARCQRL
jgi:hypothetical protein